MKIRYFLFAALLLTQSCGKDDPTDTPIDETPDTTEEIAVPTLGAVSFSKITTTTVLVQGQVTNKGGALVTNRGVCWSKSAKPTIADNSLEATSVNGAGEFSVELTDLEPDTKYYVRTWAKNSGGIAYSEESIFTTLAVQSVTFENNPMFIIGSMRAAYDVKISSNGGGQITEKGIVWSTSLDPTINDQKFVADEAGEDGFRGILTELTERTNYYMRPYAINEKGVSYGENIAFKTIGKGKLTYTLNKSESPTAEQLAVYARLQEAADSAVWYIENYTSLTKHVWINYATDTPTADANNEGWMRFGTGVGYQNLRTMLHELNHTFGTGTTSWWWYTAMINGKYQLQNVNEILRLITKDDEAVLNGDTQHWWPYGLNQNSEVTSSWDYVYNCLIIEAMRKDGLTHSGTYTP